MKITRNNYPFLKLIENRKLNFTPSEIEQELSPGVIKSTSRQNLDTYTLQASNFIRTFNKVDYKISLFSKSLHEKVVLIFKKLDDLRKELPDCKGIFLLPDDTYAFYKYQSGSLTILHGMQGTFYGFGTMTFDVTHPEARNDENIEIQMIPTPSIIDNNLWFGDDYEHNLIFNSVLGYLLFYHLVETEIVIISEAKSYKRNAVINSEEYSTQSLLKIEIVDSNWFRTLMRTEGFGVSGHFRLQPIGTNRRQRKVIWIDAFEKQGYNLKAKIEQKEGDEGKDLF